MTPPRECPNMRDLRIGERVPLTGAPIEIAIEGPQLEKLGERLDAVLIALDAGRKIPSVFEPITLAKRELRCGASFGDRGALRIDFAALPAAVERLMLALYIVGGIGSGVTFRDFATLTARIEDFSFPIDFTNRGEAAVILVEIYRHQGGWRLSANGQGFVGGIGALASAFGIVVAVPDPPRAFAGSDNDRGAPSGPSSGSGFAIDATHILTNAHVVDGARKIEVMSETFTAAAEAVFSDPHNDIALIRVERHLTGIARFRDSFDIHLGEDIVVLGFPLQGLLGSGPQVTAGNVSSLCGIGNDSGVMQFSAPIASGNSGGPILDASGLVIGLVHSSLNLERVRRDGGNAENINFGAKGSIVRSFLKTVGIEHAAVAPQAQRPRAEIVRDARAFIYRIRCDG